MNFAERIKAERVEAMRVSERITRQFDTDAMQIALHRSGWGYDKIMRLTELVQQVRQEYSPAFQRKNPEADVYQHHMDQELKEISKKVPIIPFSNRYPELKPVDYKGRAEKCRRQ